ncbi:MAG: putative LPS assembly protein LptD, partial [Bacteroidaceae bacterium]
MTPLKLSNTYILFLLFAFFLLLPNESQAQRQKGKIAPIDVKADTLVTDTATVDSASIVTPKKQALNAPVIYEANDSIVFTQGGFAHLYGQAKVNYEKIELAADIITMNMDSSTVFATGIIDTLGVMKGAPIFKDGETPYESKEMRYNFKTKKGFIKNVVTQQGEGYVTSNDAKKGGNDELYMHNGKYSTCDDHEHPHFYLKLTYAKVKPKKNVVFGPAYLVVADVPLPLAIPFGFFPFTSSYSSGFIMPSYGDEMNRGFYLQNGGYYFAISDKIDMKLTGDIFTKGSWALGLESNYNKRYKFSGNMNLRYQITKTGEKNMPDYSVSKDFKVMWTHRQDPKSSPNSTFSASVNFATSSYERSNIDSYYDPNQFSQNTKTSSVSYSHNFPDQKLTISGTFNIAQTMRDSSVAITLPDLNISLSRIFPFKRKKAAGTERWYEKISLAYTGQLRNSINTKDYLLLKSNLIKDWDNGMSHSIPISATFSLFKYINISPTFSYTSRWYTNKVMRSWDTATNKEVEETKYGFNRVYNYSGSIQANTKLYGFYKPLKSIFGDKIEMIRHVFTPTVSFSAAPDFGKSRYGFWETYTYTDKNGEVRTKEYSPYSNGMFGTAPRGKQGNINFSISNNLEMKIKSDKDSTGVRKISLIDELSAGMSYNMAAKTHQWSDLSMTLRMKLTKSYTLNLSTSFATYAYEFNKNGDVVVGDRTEWSYGRFGRFQGLGSSFSYTFNNDTWKNWFEPKEDNKNKDEDKEKDRIDETEESANSKKETKKAAQVDADGYLAFKMPWSFSLSYSFNLREDRGRPIRLKSMRYPYMLVHTLSGNGNIKIADKWNFSFSTSYDFDAHEIAQTTCTITR